MSDCNHLRVFNEFAKTTDLNIAVLTGTILEIFPHVRNSSLRKIFKGLSLLICHINIGKEINKSRDKDVIIVHGFSTEFLWCTYLYSLFRTRSVFFLTHHNIQQAYNNKILKILFKVYCFLGYRFILNETCSVLEEFEFNCSEINRHISMLHPVLEYNNSVFSTHHDDNSIKKVGIIGKFGKGKKILENLNRLLALQDSMNFSLIIGTDNLNYFGDIDLGKAKLISTSRREDYLSALALCDVVVLGYERSQYFFRCSGVAADAISCKTYVVCPDFPLLNSQTNHPSKVGVLYDSDSSLEYMLQEALQLVSSDNNSAFEKHHYERSIKNVTDKLAQDIEILFKSM